MVNRKFNMEEQAESTGAFTDILDESVEILCCGSNLFGQIECLNKDASNIIVNTPRKLADIKKNCNIGPFNRNSSAIQICQINVCVTWDRIICQCGKDFKTVGNGQHVCQLKEVKQATANGNVTCLVTNSGTTQYPIRYRMGFHFSWIYDFGLQF